MDGRDRAFAMSLAYGVVQRRATLDHVIESLSDRAADRIDPVLAALRLGVHQLLFMDGVADHAAVAEFRGSHQGGTQSRPRFRERGPAQDCAGGAGVGGRAWRILPRRPRCATRTPSGWRRPGGISSGPATPWTDADGNEPAESAARVNTLRATREDVLAELAGQGVAARAAPHLPEGIVLDDPHDLHHSAAFERGARCLSRGGR